jgi:30S ribosomal protein S31
VLLLVPELFTFKQVNFADINLKKIIMGRGDKKTAKGKRFQGSFGKSRPANVKKATPVKKEDEKKKS